MGLPSLYGLVLAGGQSRRMGTEKRFIRYHNVPQQQYIRELLLTHCEKAFISLHESASIDGLALDTILFDREEFGNAGPVSGLLTAFATFPGQSWLVAGCDYPYLSKKALEELVSARNPVYDTVVFWNKEAQIPEPLIGVYESACHLPLREEFEKGHESLKHFLSQVRSLYLPPADPLVIVSVDTPEMFNKVKSTISPGPAE